MEYNPEKQFKDPLKQEAVSLFFFKLCRPEFLNPRSMDCSSVQYPHWQLLLPSSTMEMRESHSTHSDGNELNISSEKVTASHKCGSWLDSRSKESESDPRTTEEIINMNDIWWTIQKLDVEHRTRLAWRIKKISNQIENIWLLIEACR